MFKYMMEFLKQCASLKKPLPKHYFPNLLKDLSNEDLVTICGLLATKFGKPKKNYMQLQGSRFGSHNMKETKLSNHL
jgi:hypothetical protein